MIIIINENPWQLIDRFQWTRDQINLIWTFEQILKYVGIMIKAKSKSLR